MLTTKIIASLLLVATTATAAVAAPCAEPAQPVPTAPVYYQQPQPVYQQPAYQPVYQQTTYAQPVYAQPTVQATVQPRPVFTRRPIGHGPVVRPVTLASDAFFKSSGHRAIAVNSPRAFDKLMITSERGRTTVGQVIVTFADGEKKVIGVNEAINPNASLTVDLGCREQITNVDVFGEESAVRIWNRNGNTKTGFTLTAV